MSQIQTKYFPGRGGLATEFSLSETPIEYSRAFTNRFINVRGDAEKRQGISRLNNQVPGAPTITGIHEFVDNTGNVTLFVSANGTIWRENTSTSDWDQVLTGKDQNSRLISVQMAGKLIFVNGVDRNFYTDDGGDSFKELKAIVESGQATSGTDQTNLDDSNVTSWTAETFVTNNDIVYNATRNAFAVVTSVGAGNITNSPISTSATGLGFSPSGSQTSGDKYEIIDTIALNIIPTAIGQDNFATLTSGTSSTNIAVSGVNFANTDAKVGDFIYNTTRNAVTAITSVGSTLTVDAITGQTANDSVQFFKSSMPIATWPHVHFGRLYLIDARQQSNVRVSGPNDPTDFTTSQRTLEAITSYYSTRQPQAEILLSLRTFQQYLVAGGQRNVYADTGINPISDTTAQSDFQPVGVFPQGCASRFALESIGLSMTFGANDGLRSFASLYNANALQTNNLSEVIKSEVAIATANKASDPDDIQCIHYPRRNWLLYKIGDVIYNYNYTPSYQDGQIVQTSYASFSKFTGKFAQQKVYFTRRNGDLICAGANGRVYEFDKGSYSDDGDAILTVMRSAFLGLDESKKEDIRYKTGTYIKPVFETSVPIEYTLTAVGGFDEQTTDSTTFTTPGVGMVGFSTVGGSPIGGQRIATEKKALRWKGAKFYVEITTETTYGPDIITGYTVYGNILGKL